MNSNLKENGGDGEEGERVKGGRGTVKKEQ